jgi:hypothetical protein
MKCHICDDEATEVVTGVTERYFCKEHYDEFNRNNRERNEGSSMKRIYVAGPYSGGDVLTVFDNMRRGMVLATQVRQLGYAPFAPWMDFMYFFVNPREAFDLENCYEYSLAWLEVSDAILFTPDWRESTGAFMEYKYAVRKEIPIFYTLADLALWGEPWED